MYFEVAQQCVRKLPRGVKTQTEVKLKHYELCQQIIFFILIAAISLVTRLEIKKGLFFVYQTKSDKKFLRLASFNIRFTAKRGYS